MKAIRVQQFGGPEVMKLEESSIPAHAPQAHEAVLQPGAHGKIVLVP